MVQERIYRYFERNPQLHVLFIFDRMNIIQTELQGVTWDESLYVFKVFDGAWFNTKYAIENTWKDKRIVLLFADGTYPHSEEKMLKFPLLDMLKANMEYKEDDYASFMQQYNLPEKFRLFIKNNISEIQSTKILSMLAGHLTPETFNEDLVCRAFITSYLGEKKLLDWEPIIIRMIILGMDSEEKKRNEFFHRLSKNLDAKKAVDTKLKRIFDRSYNPNSELIMKEVAECLKYNSITQLLDVAPGDNYKQYKIKNPLMLDGQNKIYEYGLQSRQLSEKFNQAMIELGKDIKEEEIIGAYGIDAQFNYMPEALCWPILKEILENKGYETAISRKTNLTEDDLDLFEIVSLAANSGADVFFSIHSNATGIEKRVNFPLGLYRGWDGKPAVEGSMKLSQLVMKHLYGSELAVWTNNQRSNGDWSFYDWGYKVGLGVLRFNKLPGFLSEGSFHDYLPERERLLSDSYCWLEAWNQSLGFDEYFGRKKQFKNGVIAGTVRWSDIPRHDEDTRQFAEDRLLPINGALLRLYNGRGALSRVFKVDNRDNGVFVFTNLEPDNYKLELYYGGENRYITTKVKAKKNQTSYKNLKLSKDQKPKK